MKRRTNTREIWYDRLHRGFVMTSVGLTLVGSIFLGIQVYNYLTIVRPLRRQLQEQHERELLKEGMTTEIPNTN